jgi:hypothetical protein
MVVLPAVLGIGCTTVFSGAWGIVCCSAGCVMSVIRRSGENPSTLGILDGKGVEGDHDNIWTCRKCV